MPDKIIGIRQFSNGILRNVHEDDRGQYIIDDDGHKVRVSWIVPNEDLLNLSRSSPTKKPEAIGICRFTDGMHRIVYRDQHTQFVFDDEGIKVRGNWLAADDLVFAEDEADTPIIARAEHEEN